MMKWKNELSVAYAADDNYAKYLGISMLSLFKRNEDFHKIKVYILDCGIGGDNIDKIRGIGDEYHRQVEFIAVEEILKGLKLDMTAHQIAPAAYARLFLAKLLPQDLDRILYLDCDTIITDSLKGVWALDLGINLIGGVQDTVDRHFHRIVGLEDHIPYVNSGVLLINLKLWRKEKIEESFIKYIDEFAGAVPHHDQGIINGVCGQRRLILPLRYNVMSNVYAFTVATIKRMYFVDKYYSPEDREEALNNPAVVHFTPGIYGRPWELGCKHPAREKYLQALRQSPWKDEPLSPSSLKRSVKLFAILYEYMPLRLFQSSYRLASRIMHYK